MNILFHNQWLHSVVPFFTLDIESSQGSDSVSLATQAELRAQEPHSKLSLQLKAAV